MPPTTSSKLYLKNAICLFISIFFSAIFFWGESYKTLCVAYVNIIVHSCSSVRGYDDNGVSYAKKGLTTQSFYRLLKTNINPFYEITSLLCFNVL